MSEARVSWVGGPVLRARMRGPFRVHEALSVGNGHLLGEVIQLRGDELVAQVYEDTTGLEPGDTVTGSGGPLSVSVGPGLLGGIFDGLLRPLTGSDDFQVRPGISERPPGRFTLNRQPAKARR
jgi:V/A-type H+-transporting ATPase subunit A